MPNPGIPLRLYQAEAVRRIVETFAEKKRKALVVQATATGKTRVAVALCDALIRACWAKRILFLCDRRELRKQAGNAFKEFLPSEPLVKVAAQTDQGYQAAEPTRAKSLLERVFDARVDLAQAALEQQHAEAFDLAVDLLARDVAALPQQTIAVREKWQLVRNAAKPETLQRFDAATQAALRHEIAPLMQWIDAGRHADAHQFDRLVARLQVELVRGSAKVDDLRDELLDIIESFQPTPDASTEDTQEERPQA